jgi:hypothetical protein
MGEYEIRILRTDGRAAIITYEIQLNDNAAIRSALKIANGRKVEIWRGMDCIYGTGSAPATVEPSPSSPAA